MIIKNLVEKNKQIRTPIWIMRQAGRHLPEYRKIREKNNLFNMFFSPEIVKEVTLQPVRRYDLDSAIIFSDILVIPYALGMDLNFGSDSKPKLENLNKVISKKINKESFKEKLSPIYESISMVKKELEDKKSLIGFSGGAWTLYIYMLAGGSSVNFPKARSEAFSNIEQTKAVINLLSEAIYLHLEEQIKAGADIVKIFESESGSVTDLFFDDLVIKPTQDIILKIKTKYPHVKTICFPRGASFRYKEFNQKVNSDIIAIDHFIPLDWAVKNLNTKIKQGNLDPALLFCSDDEIQNQVNEIENAFGKGEYIFNLGHGILPNTPVEKVKFLVDLLRR